MHKVNPRPNTCDLLQLIEEGFLTHAAVLRAVLEWMPDHEVGEMCYHEGFFIDEIEFEEEEEYHCFNCGSEVIREDVSLGYCIACKYSDNNLTASEIVEINSSTKCRLESSDSE